jgi:two-component system nitrogen regulation response regulator GlnG
MPVKHLLIVEPDPSFRMRLEETVRGLAAVDSVADFPSARARLLERPPDLVVTNLRLDAFNGLHLVYLLASGNWPSRVLVYSASFDVSLAHEATRAGAFWEFQPRLSAVLPAYLHADLPARDRRDPATSDRRAVFRGGRRASDLAGLACEALERSPSVRRTG